MTTAPVPAECTSAAAVAAVAANVDGGLRTNLLECAGGWMAVDTFTDACPATGEEMADGCRANQHVVYFQAVEGSWTLVAFDCGLIREQHPDVPAEICPN